MKLEDLTIQIKNKNSFLCIGLDTDIDKIPKFLLNEDDPIFSFNKSIIDHTNKYCVAYKINTAFYESHGVNGWESMKKPLIILTITIQKYLQLLTLKGVILVIQVKCMLNHFLQK